MTKKKVIAYCTISLLLGILIGGFLFSKSQRRSVFAIPECSNCWNPNEVLGLLASIGIQKTPHLVPNVVYETDKTIVVRHPFPTSPYHVLILPKRDIKNIGDMGPDDLAYLTDALTVAAHLIKENNLKSYQLWTNGPGNQIAAYLHWHLGGA